MTVLHQATGPRRNTIKQVCSSSLAYCPRHSHLYTIILRQPANFCLIFAPLSREETAGKDGRKKQRKCVIASAHPPKTVLPVERKSRRKMRVQVCVRVRMCV